MEWLKLMFVGWTQKEKPEEPYLVFQLKQVQKRRTDVLMETIEINGVGNTVKLVVKNYPELLPYLEKVIQERFPQQFPEYEKLATLI